MADLKDLYRDLNAQTLERLKREWGQEPGGTLEKASSWAYPESVVAEGVGSKMASAAELAALRKPSMVGELTKTLTSPQVEEASSLLRNKAGFSKLLPMLGMAALAPVALGAVKKAQGGDIPGAALDVGTAIDPTGLVNAAGQVKERLQHPEMQKEYAKQDYLRALPPGLDLEESAIQQNEERPDNSNFQRLKNKLAGK
jgi:hypothetical protein